MKLFIIFVATIVFFCIFLVSYIVRTDNVEFEAAWQPIGDGNITFAYPSFIAVLIKTAIAVGIVAYCTTFTIIV